jgi:hypothetical protein
MSRLVLLLPLSLLALPACDGGSDDGSGSGDGDADNLRDESYFLNTTTVYSGSTECQGGDFGTVDPAKQQSVTFNGEVHDFQTEDEVPDSTVKFWLGDDINATPDDEQTADSNGAFTTILPTCTPIAYGTFTPADWEETVDTYEVHQIYPYKEEGGYGEWVNSVSQATSKIIPSVIGIQWDTSTGIIAGTAFDCEDGTEGETKYYGNAQVILHDAEGNIPQTADVFYFDDYDLPTSKDKQADVNPLNGLWVAVNIPVGTWIVEMRGYNGSDYDLLGSTVLEIKAGSVNISNIYAGHGDGISYPASCLAQ